MTEFPNRVEIQIHRELQDSLTVVCPYHPTPGFDTDELIKWALDEAVSKTKTELA